MKNQLEYWNELEKKLTITQKDVKKKKSYIKYIMFLLLVVAPIPFVHFAIPLVFDYVDQDRGTILFAIGFILVFISKSKNIESYTDEDEYKNIRKLMKTPSSLDFEKLLKSKELNNHKSKIRFFSTPHRLKSGVASQYLYDSVEWYVKSIRGKNVVDLNKETLVTNVESGRSENKFMSQDNDSDWFEEEEVRQSKSREIDRLRAIEKTEKKFNSFEELEDKIELVASDIERFRQARINLHKSNGIQGPQGLQGEDGLDEDDTPSDQIKGIRELVDLANKLYK